MGRKFKTNVGDLRHWRAKLDETIDIINKRKANSENFSSFIFFTDPHWEKNNQNAVSISNYLKPKIGTDKVIMGGDIIMGQPYMRQVKKLFDDWLENMNALGEDGWFAVRGNHDNNGCGIARTPQDVLTDDEFYDYILRFSNNKNTDGSKKLYNFVDDENAKIRYYFLDTGSSGLTPENPADINKAPYSEQLQWLKETAKELTNDWAIIVIQHRTFTGVKVEDKNVYTPEEQAMFPIVNGNVFPEFDENNVVLSPILYTKKRVLTMVSDEFTTELIPVLNDIKQDENLPDVIGVISGHTHVDCHLITTGGYPIIATTCDAGGSSSIKYDVFNKYRLPGTTSEQLMDIVQIDRTNRKLFLTRIGPGPDREFDF